MAGGFREVVSLDSDTLEYLEGDIVRIPDILYDLVNGSKRTRLYVSPSEGRIRGYLTTTAVPQGLFAVMFGETDAVAELLSAVPRIGVVIVAPSSLLETIKDRMPIGQVYPMVLMVVRRGEERLVTDNPAVRLPPESATDYWRLFNASIPTPDVEEMRLAGRVYGVFENGQLVSVASAVGGLSKAAFIMGVYTKPEHRGRGYATLATSAAVRDALASSELASLGVREDNLPAIRVYERLGFRRVGEEAWIDLGTGLKP